MSLETQIADLVSATNSLIAVFNGKSAAIDARVSAAIAATPEMRRIWYVDQVAGLDTNAGTAAAPLKTIGKAIANTPTNGICNVLLLSDYTVDSQIDLNVGRLIVEGSGARRTITAKYYGDAVSAMLGAFRFTDPTGLIGFRNIALVLAGLGGLPEPTSRRLASFIRSYTGAAVPTLVMVGFEGCIVTKAADFTGGLVGLAASGVSLSAYDTTFPSDFGGRYISGVNAGTAAATLANVITNLATL